jgi:hypothetical protein
VKEGVFVDMRKAGNLTRALRETSRAQLVQLGRLGRERVESHYDLRVLKQHYIRQYRQVMIAPSSLPKYSFGRVVAANVRNGLRAVRSHLALLK